MRNPISKLMCKIFGRKLKNLLLPKRKMDRFEMEYKKYVELCENMNGVKDDNIKIK